jgi:hypothetical protein
MDIRVRAKCTKNGLGNGARVVTFEFEGPGKKTSIQLGQAGSNVTPYTFKEGETYNVTFFAD